MKYLAFVILILTIISCSKEDKRENLKSDISLENNESKKTLTTSREKNQNNKEINTSKSDKEGKKVTPLLSDGKSISLQSLQYSSKLKELNIHHKTSLEVSGALKEDDYEATQLAADVFSWEQFIALNWPAKEGERGKPADLKNIDSDGVRVWETWKEDYEVYLFDGSKPKPWEAPQSFPSECTEADKMLTRSSKVSDVVDQTLQALPADGTMLPELKDQNGRLVRYEIRLNEKLFNYILKNGLYNGETQAKAQSIDFPIGSQLLKAAWREVDKKEAPFFLTTEACVCEDTKDGKPSECGLRTMGLAGFHLMTKTESAPQWIWSTYEQVDNTTAIHPQVTPLNDPECTSERCPPNLQTPQGVPTQLTRVIPIPEGTANLNKLVQNSEFFENSFIKNYELVGTQWPVNGGKDTNKTVFSVKPELLANTTMESFSQNTSSCMGCHVMSRTLNPYKYVSADFSFTLNNAKPLPEGSTCTNVEASESCNVANLMPLPDSPQTPWEKENWEMIEMGYRMTTQTYETAGSKYVGNRLHCESCHLNGGGNPEASWWVHMEEYYNKEKGRTLQERINGCFERSMNGHALCSGDECEKNSMMNGLVTYMEWLSKQYDANPIYGANPPRGFAGDLDGKGDYDRGREIYLQKCAYCHNNDGQGRYDSHTYFRPALWGADSYNSCAGMSKPAMLANFLHKNMPYTSGGMLSAQEANDLATYIDSQCRPGKGGIGPNAEICSLSHACVNGKQP